MTYEEAMLKLIEYYTTQEDWAMVERLFFDLGVKELETVNG